MPLNHCHILSHIVMLTYADSPADRAQECFDDFGCPHTLEHLIFLGSERYPFKGQMARSMELRLVMSNVSNVRLELFSYQLS